MLGCPIRGSRDQWSLAPAPGLSQLITPFIACESLGIRRTPFLAFSYLRLPHKGSLRFLLEYTLGSTLHILRVIFHTRRERRLEYLRFRFFTFCFRLQYVKERCEKNSCTWLSLLCRRPDRLRLSFSHSGGE